MRMTIFEDAAAEALGPIAAMRPVFELVCGQLSLRERLLQATAPSQWGGVIREHLAPAYRETHPTAHVNDVDWLNAAPTLWINARWLPDLQTLRRLADAEPKRLRKEAGVVDGTLVYAFLEPRDFDVSDDFPCERFCARVLSQRTAVRAGGRLIGRPWDLIEHNAQQLVEDFALRRQLAECGATGVAAANLPTRDTLAPNALVDSASQTAITEDETTQPIIQHPVAVLGDAEDVWVAPTASIDPFVVLDARQGPIAIDRRAKIQSFTRLEGPCYVGCDSQLFRANVRGETTIGPVCRVGGEVEASILHGYVNKYHDGFLGHSYVCPWVNLGAMTTNSDLKNDYSHVSVPVGGERVATGRTKVGCFIGDHAKTALMSPFNTGATVGVMSMVLPGGELLPKHIPSFCRVWHGQLDDSVELDALFETARVVMQRRGCQLTPAYEQMLRHHFHATAGERQQAIARARQSAGNRRAA